MGRRRKLTIPAIATTATTTTARMTRINTMAPLLLLFLLAYLTPWASGFSLGAPDTTCSTLEPVHGVPKQTTPAPYTITPSAVEIEGGKQILITLRANDGTSFKGFLIQARNSDSGEVVGTFFTTDHKYLNCENGMNNAVTHQGPGGKSKVTLTWEAPSDFSGDVIFIGSFVQQRTIFWVGITSEKVTVRRASASPPPAATSLNIANTNTNTTTTNTTTTTTPAPSESAKLEQDVVNIYDDCGTEKGCFGYPPECESKKSCEMLVTYTKVKSGFKFEVMGETSGGYVAAGLSEDEFMGGDSVMACMVSGSEVDINMAYNEGKENELLVESKYGLSDIQTALVDGQAYCTFVRDEYTEISGKVFDLDSDRFHLMLAAGPLSSNGLTYHDKRTVSSGTVALDSFEAVEARSDLFLTLHACFMVGAWICAASCGIMVARYYKKTWRKYKSCGIDQWFHLHRFFMGLTWALTMAGLGFIVYYLDGWTTLQPHQNPHPIIGIVSICLCFIQPFMALCRCAPTDKNRPIFNWAHWFVGNSAQILGITAIFYGYELLGTPTWVFFILILFVAFHIIAHILLSVGQCVTESRGDSSNNVYPMKELNGSRTPLQPSDELKDAPGAVFRKVILFFYLLGNFLITAVLLLLIIVDLQMLRGWNLLFWED